MFIFPWWCMISCFFWLNAPWLIKVTILSIDNHIERTLLVSIMYCVKCFKTAWKLK